VPILTNVRSGLGVKHQTQNLVLCPIQLVELPDLLDHPFDHPDDPTGSHNVTDSLGKGDRVVILGQLRMRSWETPDGEQRSVVEVTAEEVGPSLRWATAKPERAARKGNGEAKPAGEFAEEPPF
jgi:hypothetical protein